MSDTQDLLLSVTREIDPGLITVRAFSAFRRKSVFYWENPDAGQLLAGIGAAWEHVASHGPDRISGASHAASGLFARLERSGAHGDAGPRLVGGFSFSGLGEPRLEAGGNRWDAFPPGSLVLPEVALQRQDDRAWITAVVPAGAGGRDMAGDVIGGSIDRLQRGASGPRVVVSDLQGPPDPQGEEAFRGLVKQAVTEVESGKLAKVVAARSAHVNGAADPWRIIDRLRSRYPSCVTYAIFRGDSVFLGASPELLVELRDGLVGSNALAGTVVRGSDEHSDARLEDRLRHDPKELAEHQYVVQGLRRALHEAGVELDAPLSLEILKLANVQHLAVPVTGTIPPGTSVLELVNAVHPTPAVAGLPRSAALDWIADNEGLDRGWYAGPIGFVDPKLDGSFRVALRCALLQGGRARLFAGAGIVAGSRPERELAETTAKLRAMLDALRDG